MKQKFNEKNLMCASFSFRPTNQFFKVVHQVEASGNARRTALSQTKCTLRPNLLFQSEKGVWHNGCIGSTLLLSIYSLNAVSLEN
jgi:hypothetical protein